MRKNKRKGGNEMGIFKKKLKMFYFLEVWPSFLFLKKMRLKTLLIKQFIRLVIQDCITFLLAQFPENAFHRWDNDKLYLQYTRKIGRFHIKACPFKSRKPFVNDNIPSYFHYARNISRNNDQTF